MRFGIFTTLYDCGGGAGDPAAVLDHVREQGALAEQLGFDAVWWHPVRLAEDLAILDNLTRGRVEVGFGRGIWPYEGPQFRPAARHGEPRAVP